MGKNPDAKKPKASKVSIEKRTGKKGVTYRFVYSDGSDSNGNRRKLCRSFTPPSGLTEAQERKTVERAAQDFVREIEQGYNTANNIKFAEYAQYVLDLKRTQGCKIRTLERYGELLERINPGIGHMKVVDIRPQHLNNLYSQLGKPGMREGADSAVAKIDLAKWLKENKVSRTSIGKKAGISASTVGIAARGESINIAKAEAIAKAMGKPVKEVFELKKNMEPLSPKTILEHHRLISTILAQADKEMLVPYNAASKASPPAADRKTPNYFQPEEIAKIIASLMSEPLKWMLMVHLYIATGARRGEICGLKWEDIDFEKSRIKIGRALLRSKKLGVYEDTTKNKTVRWLNMSKETMDLLREHKRDQLRLRIKNGDRWIDTGYVFTQDNGEHMAPDSINGWLEGFAKRHNLPHLNPHAFRHTVASVLISEGIDIATIAAILGHKSPNTTGSYYIHLIEEKMAEGSLCVANKLLKSKQA